MLVEYSSHSSFGLFSWGGGVNRARPMLACSSVTELSTKSPMRLLEIKVPGFSKLSHPGTYSNRNGKKLKKQIQYTAVMFHIHRRSYHCVLKRKHPHYYQTQYQLAVTELTWCDFVLCMVTPAVGPPHIQRIMLDNHLIYTMIPVAVHLWPCLMPPVL